MASTQQWQWDAQRGEYYIWSPDNGCWVYQNGDQVYPQNSTTPRNINQTYQPPSLPASSTYPQEEPTDSAYSVAAGYSNSAVSYPPPQQQQQVQDTRSTAEGAYGYNVEIVQRSFMSPQHYPHEQITQPILLQHNIHASKRFPGTPESKERLDPSYRVRKQGRKFFKVGKVFKILWPELAGDNVKDDMTVATVAYNERVFTKIRWFVVIVEGLNDCSCLPIQTYSNQGVAKNGLVKNQHAIIFTGSEAPQPTPAEVPGSWNPLEQGIRPPIRVKQKLYKEKLDRMSRLNYRKIYTVEHNVKVREFGEVHKDYEERLVSNFYSAWGFQRSLAVSGLEDGTEEEEDDGEDDDDDEGDEPSGNPEQAE